MEGHVKISADFHNADTKGRVRLNTVGSLNDIASLKDGLQQGMVVLVSDNEELETLGTVEYSDEEKIWVAIIDWNKFF